MKKIILTLTAATVGISLIAAPITPRQALQRLAGEGGAHKALSLKGDASPRLVLTAQTPALTPAVYAFNYADGEGFVLLSADDAAAPLLGYSTTGSLDPENMPPALTWWIDEYAASVQYAASHAAPAFQMAAPEARPAIAPMLTSSWDQVTPYNNLCPLYDGERTYTGCVATSMAQVMNYWKYPEVGQGGIAYTDANLDKRITMNFAKQVFDWDNMLDDYSAGYTDEQATAVASLMRAAAYSVKMNFSTQASAAYALNVAEAMSKYFDYDPAAHYEVRNLYSATEWEQMIYDNLATCGPVIYGGSSMLGGGHSFICDGYDGNGYFHFNWGWSGMSNGYFLLDALVPGSLGSGGGNGGGYSFSQDAVFGIRPNTGAEAPIRPLEIVQGGGLTASVDGSKVSFKLAGEDGAAYLNYATVKVNATFGLKFEATETTADPVYAPIDHDPIALASGYGTTEHFKPYIDMSKVDLPDGVYKVTMVADIAEDTAFDWVPTRPLHGYYNYVTLTKKGNEYSIGNNSVSRIHVVDAEFAGPLYFASLTDLTVTVRNDTDYELTRGIAPALYYNPDGSADQLYFLGTSECITVPAHSEITHSWTCDLIAMVPIISMSTSAELQLTFFDEATYNYYTDDIYKTVTMNPSPGLPAVKVSPTKIANGEGKLRTIDGKMLYVWDVKNKLDIQVTYNMTLQNGVPYHYTTMACLVGADPNEQGALAVYAYGGYPVALNADNTTHTFLASLEYPFMQPGELYQILPAFLYSTTFLPLTDVPIYVRYMPESGVEDVMTSETSAAPIYNLQGICVGTDLNALPAGIYIQGGRKVRRL